MTASKVEIRISKPENESAVIVEEQSSIDNRQSSITLPLLLEVGCEEIPARFLRDAQKGLGDRVHAALVEARLLPGRDESANAIVWAVPDQIGTGREPPLQTFSTPRRLVVYVPALLAQQPDKVEEILGPPVKVAIDAEGNYTRVAESFAQKNSARTGDLTRTTTPKGEYLSLRKITRGRSAYDILREILPGVILGLAFPRSMHWESSGVRWVRPIRWLLALLGDGKRAKCVPFTIAGVKSGNLTFGHRLAAGKGLAVAGFEDFAEKLRMHYVEFDPETRRQSVRAEINVLLEDCLEVIPDQDLEEWIVNSTEWLSGIRGVFDENFLNLPREILITVMRDHQKYFAVQDDKGRLRPHFIALLNRDRDPTGQIRSGHQRVLTARFRDAEFFWSADQKVPLRDRVPLLDTVIYQAKLGSYGDKIRRMRAIAENICTTLEASGRLKTGQASQVLRAIELCKCDLTTQMVQEFTELQGIVGGLYAKAQGESEEVATAIYDHYLPLGAEGPSPRTLVGALVSLADKVDSVVAGFAVGYEPTGSSDPFALRRQANGAVKVILESSLPLSLKEEINKAVDVLDIQWRKPRDEVCARVLDFFAERLRYYFESVRSLSYDTVRAVLAAGADQPADSLARAEAVEALRGGEDFDALSAAAKRIRNILAKSATAADWQVGEVVPELLTEPQEKDLYGAYERIAGEVERRRAGRDYRRALEEISTLRPAVDRFFDKVLVMAENREVRQNRLRLLKKLDELFSRIAHFAEIVDASTSG